MFTRTILGLSVAALTLTGVAQAQDNATFTLRSGERISAQLLEMSGMGFTVRIDGRERQILTNDVAVIDFTSNTMSDADWVRLNRGQQLLWLRNGDTINGQLYDIRGSSRLRITFSTSSGEREFSSSEIRRIVLARPTSEVATSGSIFAPPTRGGIVVTSRQPWTATGLMVRAGQVLTLNTTGEVQLSSDAADVANSAGSKTGRHAPNAAIPSAFAGALIGRIGPRGRPFGIGNATSVPMPTAGELYLGVNDDAFEDNQGEFRVAIGRPGYRR